MNVIREKRTLLGTVYERYDNHNKVIQRFGAIGFVKRSTDRKMTYFIITDINGNLIEEANRYLNYEIGDAKYKKRERAFSALKVFFSFLNMLSISNPKDLKKHDIRGLRMFLEGGKREGQIWNFDFDVRRDNKTFNHYLNVYRDYLDKIHNISIFDNIKIQRTFNKGLLAHAKSDTSYRQLENKMVGDKGLSVPKYIRPSEYKNIIEIVESKYNLREKIIIELMYHYGLRIGEILGTTFEDLEPTNNGTTYRLIIRNRVSDKPTQRAKGVMVPTSTDDYKRRSYNMEGNGLGYQVVIIDEEMAELIKEYIDESRDNITLSKSSIKRENLNMKSKADKVGSMGLINNDNQYIFLNYQHYTPLSQAGWNYILRKIFKEAGISTDKHRRETNLNHRFRHGFAMKLIKLGFNELELQRALRHKSSESCRAYYNPDDDDKYALLMKYKERPYYNE